MVVLVTRIWLLMQVNRRVLATDEWLRVERTDSIYALGDCATINQRKVMVLPKFVIVKIYSQKTC